MRAVLHVLAAAACVAALSPSQSSARVRFRLPLADPTPIWVEMLLHVDQDPEEKGQGNVFCLAHDCIENFPSCYDQHRGTDFVLEGGFEVMDQGTVQVVAAAPGTVVRAVDGNYDRCHANLSTQQVDCDGYPMQANFVELRHADGTVTLYYHLKKGSVAVREGDEVGCGDVLGLVGSSGNSSMPHVHFQVEDSSGAIIDPFSGPCSHPDTWWVVEDAGNGLPGPWCEGEVIPEPAVETVETADAGVTEGPAEEDGPAEVPVEAVVESVDRAEDLPGDGTESEDAGAEVTGPADPGGTDVASRDLDVLEPADPGVADLGVADPGVADLGATDAASEDTRGILSLPGGFGCSSGATPGGVGVPWGMMAAVAALLLGLRRRVRGEPR